MSTVPKKTRPYGRGNALGFWLFGLALRFTGLRGAYGLLYFVAPYYALFDRPATAAARAYLRHRFPQQSHIAQWFSICQLFIQQGKCLIDRVAHNTGHITFQFDITQIEQASTELDKSPTGYILLLSHTGGWQLALPHLRNLTPTRPISLLMNPAENPEVHAHIRGNDAGLHIISPEDGPACIIEMVTRLQRGEIVSIMGDRAFGSQTVAVPFLGEDANFPASAFAVARAAQSPILVLFAPKISDTSYTLQAQILPPPSRDDRNSIRATLATYALALEHFSQQHPLQNFLFENIWPQKFT